MSKKRASEDFFTPHSQKKARVDTNASRGFEYPSKECSSHVTYPYAIPHLPQEITDGLRGVPASKEKIIDDQPDLDLLYFKPYIPTSIAPDLFVFLRRSLPFYRVQYDIKRGNLETQINTPRFTTVFGVDESFYFSSDGKVLGRPTWPSVPSTRYTTCAPRPIPQCLDYLRRLTEALTDTEYNFCLVNYYASGSDSISYHSDDERFLGPDPAIASLSLGATRDFCMKHKPFPPKAMHSKGAQNDTPPLKLSLGNGDMILMRGKTQANWLHSIPKRKGKGAEGGRINITFRKGINRYATENYYHFNVGNGDVWKWDEKAGEMMVWKPSADVAGTGP